MQGTSAPEWLEVEVGAAGRWAPVREATRPLARGLTLGRADLGGDPNVGGQHLTLEEGEDGLRLLVLSGRGTGLLEGGRLVPLARGEARALTAAALEAGVCLSLGQRFVRLTTRAGAARGRPPSLTGSSLDVTSAELQLLPMGLAQAVVALVTAPVAQVEGLAAQVCARALAARRARARAAPPPSPWRFSAPLEEGAVLVLERDFDAPPFSEEERRVCEQVVVALQRASEAGPAGAPDDEVGGDPRREVLRWFDDFLGGESPAVQTFHEDLARIAADMGRRLGEGGPAPILLLSGEPGVGKDRAAGAVHTVLGRLQGRRGPFVSINLAAVPDTLAEAELFGIAASAATGVKARAGAFERAQGGTIFLNEVDKCPRPLQAKLLTVLESRKVTRIGGEDERDVDAVVVAANNGRMPDLVREGVVIQPLADRLGVPLEVPPLRERGRDLELYASAFLAAGGLEPPTSTPVVRALAALPWPGNIRQLKNVVERVCQLGRTDAQGVARIHALTMPTPDPREAPRVVDEPRYRGLHERWVALGRSDAALAGEQGVDERTVRNWKRRWRELGLEREDRPR